MGYLVQPRVEVIWGTLNLSCPMDGQSEGVFEGIDVSQIGPLVYDVRVSLEDQGQTPTGSMKWNPSGLAYQIYEKCIEKFRDYSIVVTFFYPKPYANIASFEFYWGGQSEVIGKDLDITVKLVSLFDGLINANFFASVQANKDEKPLTILGSINELYKQFGVDDNIAPLLTSFKVKDNLERAVIKANYNDGSTLIDAIQNLLKVTGYNAFFSNLYEEGRGGIKIIVYSPYSIADREYPEGNVITEGSVYFLLPGMFQNFTRTYEWQPPQKSQELSSILARKLEAKREAEGKGKTRRSTPENSQDSSSQNAKIPEGVYMGKVTNGVLPAGGLDFEFGARNQDLFTKERSAKLSLTLFAFPYLIGIRPRDIILIPSLKGDFVEDWIIASVEYQQTQGGVDISIQATRVYGLGTQMNPNYTKVETEYLTFLVKKGSLRTSDILEESTFLAWQAFANKYNVLYPPRVSRPAPTSTQPSQQNQPGQAANQQQGQTLGSNATTEYYDPKSRAEALSKLTPIQRERYNRILAYTSSFSANNPPYIVDNSTGSSVLTARDDLFNIYLLRDTMLSKNSPFRNSVPVLTGPSENLSFENVSIDLAKSGYGRYYSVRNDLALFYVTRLSPNGGKTFDRVVYSYYQRNPQLNKATPAATTTLAPRPAGGTQSAPAETTQQPAQGAQPVQTEGAASPTPTTTQPAAAGNTTSQQPAQDGQGAAANTTSNRELRRSLDQISQQATAGGKKPYVTYSNGDYKKVGYSDPLLFAYTVDYYSRINPNPEVFERISKGVRKQAGFSIEGLSRGEVEAAYRSYVSSRKVWLDELERSGKLIEVLEIYSSFLPRN